MQDVALSTLVPSARNVRRSQAEAGVPELAANIAVCGVLQNLNVRKTKKGKYEVVAGHRRFCALKLLQKQGGAVKGIPVTGDFPISVSVLTDEIDTEVSLIENIQRLTMNPVDEIDAFRTLNEEMGLRPEDIAARTGISHMTVRRRLKLATVSPRLLDVLREGGMTLEQAEALSVSPDHQAQERVWDGASNYYRQPRSLREMLTKEAVGGNSRLAKFAGVEAYRAAGGLVEEDLFSTEDEIYLIDRDIVIQLVEAKLEAAAAEVRTEGWAWVDHTLDGADYYSMGRVYPKPVPLSEEAEATVRRLRDELDAVAKQLDEAAGTDAEAKLEERFEALEAEIANTERPLEEFTAEQKATAGAFVYPDYEGKLTIARGMLRKGDKAPAPLATEIVGDDGAVAESAPAAVKLNAALTEDLTAQRTAALRCELAERPEIAMAALLYPLALRSFYEYAYGGPAPAVEIRPEHKDLAPLIKDGEASRALQAWAALIDRWRATVPQDKAQLWTWLIEQDVGVLSNLLAVLTAANLNAVHVAGLRQPDYLDNADRIADTLQFDMRRWWSPGRPFLSRISKAAIGGIMREAGLPAAAAADVARLPKSQAVDRAELDLAGRGWLPEALTSRPANVAPTAATDDDAADDDGDGSYGPNDAVDYDG